MLILLAIVGALLMLLGTWRAFALAAKADRDLDALLSRRGR